MLHLSVTWRLGSTTEANYLLLYSLMEQASVSILPSAQATQYCNKMVVCIVYIILAMLVNSLSMTTYNILIGAM